MYYIYEINFSLKKCLTYCLGKNSLLLGRNECKTIDGAQYWQHSESHQVQKQKCKQKQHVRLAMRIADEFPIPSPY